MSIVLFVIQISFPVFTAYFLLDLQNNLFCKQSLFFFTNLVSVFTLSNVQHYLRYNLSYPVFFFIIELYQVMKKVFALLLAEFRKLGANVIFANFSKIIIDTGKVDLSSAHAYCDSLLKTLQTRYRVTTYCK